MSRMLVYIPKRAVGNTKRQTPTIVDLGPFGGPIDGLCRLSVWREYIDHINGEHEKRRRRKKTLRKRY